MQYFSCVSYFVCRHILVNIRLTEDSDMRVLCDSTSAAKQTSYENGSHCILRIKFSEVHQS